MNESKSGNGMRLTGYAYPWDVVGDNGFVDRTTALGVETVAIATAYHSTRAATGWQPNRTAVLADHAAFYRPIRAEAWRDQVLVPERPSWIQEPDIVADAVNAVRAGGLSAAAWIVFTHSTILGRRHPEFAVRNCFGETYPWALCPSAPEVRSYAATIAAESVRDLDVSTVILEACGQVGVTHQCMHEKTDGAWSAEAVRMLSICCCERCVASWRSVGLDPDATRTGLADATRAAIAGEPAPTLDPEVGARLLAVRQRATDDLRTGVVAAIGPGRRIVLHGHPDPWQTGALVGLTPTTMSDVDSVVVPCWQVGDGSIETVRRTRAAVGDDRAVGGYVTAVAATPHEDIDAYVSQLAEAGATELHLYHLGLAGPARWPYLERAIAASRSGWTKR